MIIIVMGVTGVGKTTIGSEVARRLGCDFLDADLYHSPANKAKMSQGIPLTDEDRLPWLQTLHGLLLDYNDRHKDVVLACSALKQSYRDILGDSLKVSWVFLTSSESVIRDHLTHRQGHFAGVTLLKSQLETLEKPADAITVDVSVDPNAAVEQILGQLTEP
jgi:gluconokinase